MTKKQDNTNPYETIEILEELVFDYEITIARMGIEMKLKNKLIEKLNEQNQLFRQIMCRQN